MDYEFTFILPCLNEERTLKYCIDEIKKYIFKNKINGEILVVDNNSIDKSKDIAIKNGVRVVCEKNRGYGNALRTGTINAYGKYCIMGDCDGSYDFSDLNEFIEACRNSYDLVVGNRFKGGIEKGAMSISHKIGGQMLSILANIFFNTKIHDYHCGLRAYNRESILNLNLETEGMEYASEMIIKAKINNLKLLEIPTKLRKDLRNEKSKLRTIRDGFRHLNLILNMAFFKKKYTVKEILYEKND